MLRVDSLKPYQQFRITGYLVLLIKDLRHTPMRLQDFVTFPEPWQPEHWP